MRQKILLLEQEKGEDTIAFENRVNEHLVTGWEFVNGGSDAGFYFAFLKAEFQSNENKETKSDKQ